MRAGTLAFAAGVLLLVRLPALPDPFLVQFLPVLLLAATARSRVLRWPALAACGFLWALLRAALILQGDLPPALEGRDLRLEGVVASLPEGDGLKTRFRFEPVRAPEAWRRPGTVRLNWYGEAPDLEPGQRWRLTVRLRRARGFMNPGGFDYERWLFRRGIRATGYVRAYAPNRLLGEAPGYAVTRLRHRLSGAIEHALGGHPQLGTVKALAIGARDRIREEQWDVLRATGTGHLMAISGLHVGLVAGAAYALARGLWSWCPGAALRLAAPRFAALAGLLAAAGYAALAGFSVPTQRALVMVAVVMGAVLLRRNARPSASLAAALALVLILDPFAPLGAGFWLSFAAVALILFGMSGRLGARGVWWRWGRVQVLVGLGLLPCTLALFGEHPLVGPLANLVAVPWVSVTAVPAVLAGTAVLAPWPELGAGLLGLGAGALALLWPYLEMLEGLGAVYRPSGAPSLWAVLAALPGVAWLLMPRGTPARWVGLAWLLPLVLAAPERPGPGVAHLTLLDVGQGLAAVVETRSHVLVYDTGPRYGPTFDAGRAVVVPFLRRRGIASVDRLVVSHGNTDHAGGLQGVMAGVQVAEVVSGEALPGLLARSCHPPLRWRWDGVDFRVFAAAVSAQGNDASCVLHVQGAGGGILVPGDIERAAEAALVRRWGARLKADVLVVPHHGSRTSSTRAFLQAVAPRMALISSGYRNRFEFPHPDVMARYRGHGIALYGTARHGAISLRIHPERGVVGPELHRREARRFWHAAAD